MSKVIMRPNVFLNLKTVMHEKEKDCKAIGVVCPTDDATAVPRVVRFSSFDEVSALYNKESTIYNLLYPIFLNAGCDVIVVIIKAGNEAYYKDGIDLLLKHTETYCILCDVVTVPLIEHMKLRLNTDGFCATQKMCIASLESNADHIAVAKSTNCPRICITYPKLLIDISPVDVASGLMAAAITKGMAEYETKSAFSIRNNLAGHALKGEFRPYPVNTTEDRKNELLYNGVTVFESINQTMEIIRAVTTSTLDKNSVYSSRYRDLSTIAALDTVIITLTQLLNDKLKGITSAPCSLGTVLSLVISKLDQMQSMGIISSFVRPQIRTDAADASVCIIDVSVALAQGVNQIYLNLNIRV